VAVPSTCHPHASTFRMCSPAAGRGPRCCCGDSYRKEGDDRALWPACAVIAAGPLPRTTVLRSATTRCCRSSPPCRCGSEERGALAHQGMVDFSGRCGHRGCDFHPVRRPVRSPQMSRVAAKNEVIAAAVKPFHEPIIPLEVIDIPELTHATWPIVRTGTPRARVSWHSMRREFAHVYQRGGALPVSPYGRCHRQL